MLTAVTTATGNSAGAKLRCLYTNAQSLISKLDELKLCLVELSPDVLAVTETWLSANISDNEVALPGYQIYRRDREHRQSGGIVVYVNDGLAVSDNTTKFACSTEAIWLTSKATGSPCLDVLTVYRPPRTDRIANAQLLEQLDKFSSRPNTMIMGDFNAPGTNWNTLQASGPKSAFDYRLLSKTLNACLTQHSWTRALDDRHAVHIAFMDFQKAFDTVPHQRLLHKLKKIGIGGNFLTWIENFLVGRQQVVCVGRGKSDPALVDSGVPQGSVLGPILFLIYVDDAARDLDCEVAMFADDMKIWSVIRGPADEDRLQMNLNRLEEWSNRWLLRFNVAKCSILRLGNTTRSASTRGYFLGGAALQEVEAHRDLGVLTTSSLKPSAYCSRVAKTAMSVLQTDVRLWYIFVPTATPGLHQLLSSHSTLPTTKTDRTHEPPPPLSFSTGSTSDTAAPVPTATAHNPDTPTSINYPTVNASDAVSVHTCSHCNRTFTSHIGLIGHLRIYRTETGKPVPGAPTYTRRIHLHYPHYPRTFNRRLSLSGHIRINESGTDRSLDAPSTSCTSTMPCSTPTPPPSTPATTSSTTLDTSYAPTMPNPTHASSPSLSTLNSSTTATISETDTDTADSSSHTVPVHSPHTSAWSVTC
nr:unnamed protein product [Spirometra erinaceieuropaei]